MTALGPTINCSNVGRRQRRGRRGPGGGGPLQALDAGQQRKDVVVAERLGDEIEGPQPHRFHGHRDAAVGGHHNDLQVRQRPLLDPLQQLDAVEVGHLQVGHDHVEASALQLLPGLLAIGGGNDFVALAAEVFRQGDAFDLLVVGDEDFHIPTVLKRISLLKPAWLGKPRNHLAQCGQRCGGR